MMYRDFETLHINAEVDIHPEINFWLHEAQGLDEHEKFIYFYHKDHLGSSAQISDIDANIVHHIEYMPYGENFFEKRSHWATRYKFNAKEKDEETGLYYYGARYYSPELSIWTSVDPLSDKYPSMSPFMYCAGNPVRLIDPNGMEIVITGEDGTKTTYKQGMEYKGKDNLVSKSVSTLNQINEREGGAKVLTELTGSKNIHSIENKEGGAGTLSFGFCPNKNGGGTINAAALLSVDNIQGIEGLGNELFHGYQQEMGQNPLSIDSKVGALLFGKSLVDGYGELSPGRDAVSSDNFVNAMNSLLFEPHEFNLSSFQKAVNNFKLGSGKNMPTGKYPVGPYTQFPILNLNKPVISNFFPLLK